MSLSTNRRCTGKSDKRQFRIRMKTNDSHMDQFDARLRTAHATYSILKRTYTFNSVYSRNNKTEKQAYTHHSDIIQKKLLQSTDPIVVFPDDIPEHDRIFKPNLKRISNKVPSNNVVMQKYTLQRGPIPRAALIDSYVEMNQEYRSKFAFSKIHKFTYDLLPSPALFSINSSYTHEGSKFLQEIGTDRIRSYVKTTLEPNQTAKRQCSLIKFCFLCGTDFTSSFIPLDSKQNKYICQKCSDTKRKQDSSSIDLLKFWQESPHSSIETSFQRPSNNPQINAINSDLNKIRTSLSPVLNSSINNNSIQFNHLSPPPQMAITCSQPHNIHSSHQNHLHMNNVPLQLRPVQSYISKPASTPLHVRITPTGPNSQATQMARLPLLVQHQSNRIAVVKSQLLVPNNLSGNSNNVQNIPRLVVHHSRLNKITDRQTVHAPAFNGRIAVGLPRATVIRAMPIPNINPRSTFNQIKHFTNQPNFLNLNSCHPKSSNSVLTECVPNSRIFSTRMPSYTPGLRLVSDNLDVNNKPTLLPSNSIKRN